MLNDEQNIKKKIIEIGLKSHYFVKDKPLSCFCLLL